MGARRQGIVLIGSRRAGKTSVGVRLARALGLPFIDLDDLVARREGSSPGELLLERGEEEFRKAERGALEEVLRGEPGVLATGGGTPLFDESRRLLKSYGTVVYLEVDVVELERRLASDPNPERRPLLAGRTPLEEIALLQQRRYSLYCATADVVIDASIPLEDVVAACYRAVTGSAD